MRRSLCIKKSIRTLLQEAAENKQGLKRTLGPYSLIAMGVGAIIGAGLFVLTGQVAAQYAGPAVAFSFLIAGFVCLLAALCYAEFASLIPIAGSAYSYSYVTLGELPAWIIACALTLEYLFSASTVAVGWAGYFVSVLRDFGITFPVHLASSPLLYDVTTGWSGSGSYFNLPAVVIVACMGALVAFGTKIASSFNNLMVVVKLAVIALFIGFGVSFIKGANWHPFVPPNTGVFGEYGISGIFRGASVLFFAFIGFDAISTLSQEARNPQRDMPIGMLGSLTLSGLTYFAVAVVMTGVVSYKLLNVPDPISTVVNAFGPSFLWLRIVLKLAILASLSSVVLVMILGQARIFFTVAQDGLLPRLFGAVHPKFGTPFVSTLLVSLAVLAFAAFFPVGILGQLTAMGALLCFAIVCLGVLVLRYTQPALHRPFKTPLVPYVPLLGSLASLVQMALLPGVTWIQLAIWMALGCLVYFTYSIRHSKARNIS